MIVLYKYISKLIASGGENLFNEKNMLAGEEMVMSYLSINRFRLEIRWRIPLIKEVGIRNNPKKGRQRWKSQDKTWSIKEGITLNDILKRTWLEAHKVPPIPVLLYSWFHFAGKNIHS